MNECEKYREMISAMLDDELDHADNERLIKHMSTCAECRETYELLSAVTGSDVWNLPETPRDLHTNIMSGVKSAADDEKRRTRMRRSRFWIAAAACLVVVVAVILGIPRITDRGGDRSSSSAFLNGSAAADATSPAEPAGSASDNTVNDTETAGQSSPTSEDRSDDGKSEADALAGEGSVSGENGTGEGEGANGPSETAPVPEPEDEPEEEPEPTEEPLPDMDIAESVVTVESGGGSVNETLSREDTLIWLRAVIEGPARGINVAKIEIHREEGTDYEVYFYHDGSQLMGSLTDDLSDGVELNRLADFAVFEEAVDNMANTEDAEDSEDSEDTEDSENSEQ